MVDTCGGAGKKANGKHSQPHAPKAAEPKPPLEPKGSFSDWLDPHCHEYPFELDLEVGLSKAEATTKKTHDSYVTTDVQSCGWCKKHLNWMCYLKELPRHVVGRKLTTKADVFNFGVVLVELALTPR